MAVVDLAAFGTQDCVTWSCPRPAESGQRYCAHCLRVNSAPPAPVANTDDIVLALREVEISLGHLDLQIVKTNREERARVIAEIKSRTARAARLVAALS